MWKAVNTNMLVGVRRIENVWIKDDTDRNGGQTILIKASDVKDALNLNM